MTQHFPAFLDVQGRPAVVIGGGPVCEGRIAGLLECGALVTVVAPEVTDRIRQWAGAGRITWLAREYRQGDLAGAWLAIAGTNNTEVNRRAAAEARAQHVLVNTADNGRGADFIVPAVLRSEDVALAVSTGGGSPAMARYVREQLQRALPSFTGHRLTTGHGFTTEGTETTETREE